MAKTKSINTVSKGLRKLAKQFPQWAAEALNEEAEETMTESKAMTPVSQRGRKVKGKKDRVGKPGGRLRRSGRVHHATPKDLIALLTYSTDYAVYVHEIPAPPAKSSPGGRSARHKSPTQWKYLETPVNERALKFDKRIASEIKRKLASAGA
jgi:spore germination protein YaaH